MNFSKHRLVFLIIVLISSFFAIRSIPHHCKNLKEFMTEFTKTEVTVIDVKSHYSYDDQLYTYAAICSYTDENGTQHTLDSNVYTSKMPKIGTTKQVYVNPSNPEVYYNGIGDILLPLLFPTMMCAVMLYVGVKH